jgi:hypothetical protein
MESRLTASSDKTGRFSWSWLCAHALNARIHSSGFNCSTSTRDARRAVTRVSCMTSSTGKPRACASARYACSTCGGKLSVTVIEVPRFILSKAGKAAAMFPRPTSPGLQLGARNNPAFFDRRAFAARDAISHRRFWSRTSALRLPFSGNWRIPPLAARRVEIDSLTRGSTTNSTPLKKLSATA